MITVVMYVVRMFSRKFGSTDKIRLRWLEDNL